jgi:signal transduction histidine kinase
MIRSKHLLLLFFFLFAEQWSYSQRAPLTDVATAREAVKLMYQYSWASFEKPVNDDSLPYLSLQQVKPGEYPISLKNFTRHFVFVFAFTNSSPKPDTVLFMPGLYQRISAFLYDSISKTMEPVTDSAVYITPSLDVLHFYTLIIPPGSYQELFIQTSFHHFNWDYWEPATYRRGTIDDKLLMYQLPEEMHSHAIAAVQLGILLAILGYTLILYFQYRQQEYLWYLAYVFFITVYFVIMAVGSLSYSYSFHRWDMFLPPFTQISAHLIYFFFVKKILDLPKNKPFFNLLINIVISILAAYLVFHSFISFDDRVYWLNRLGFFQVRIFLCVFSLYGIVVLYRSRIPLSFYIATGVLCVTVFGLVSMFMAFLSDNGYSFVGYIGGSITFFRIGVVIELFVFLVAITEKSKTEIINKVRTIELLQIENQKKELEKSMIALETQTAERKRISAEMHDDIGSGLTTIQFLTNALPLDKTAGQEQALQKITATSQQLMDKMNEIVWSLNQEFDTLGDTIAYIRNTVSEMLENAGILYEFSSPDSTPPLQLSGETRRNIYLVVKEATHNIIKHAQATKVKYTVTIGDTLIIVIHDNGRGVQQQSLSFGNGLRNMQKRMKDCGGKFSMINNNGTLITLVLPLHS